MQRLEHDEAGQSTAEYALVMIAAAAVAGLLVMWAHKTNLVSGLFNAVIKKVLPF
jgi:Flp pilus assembly pilin Flp